MKAHLLTLLASAAIAVTVVACDSTPDHSPNAALMVPKGDEFADCMRSMREGYDWSPLNVSTNSIDEAALYPALGYFCTWRVLGGYRVIGTN